ncbi:MAG: type II secretion system F family protein [Candidatus Aureabacteria bacterium]|nr:type II secretion system F family protein [Candidatus Auribacterota bacterium]
MSTYTYKARTSTGALREGNIIADSADSARSKLQRQSLRVFFIEEDKEKIWKEGTVHIQSIELMMMTRQLSTMVKAGVPILTAVKSLQKQIGNPGLADVLKKVELLISGGKTLSQALSAYPEIFNDLYVNVVIAGEAGGVLPEVLQRLATLIERDHEIMTEVKGALRYPTYVTLALVGAFLFLVNIVVPKFTTMFLRFKLDLPIPTRILIFLSTTMKSYWWAYLLGGIALYLGFHSFKKSSYGANLLARIQLKLPVVGELIIKFNMARFANLMSTLIRSGVPVLNCIDIIKKTVTNQVIEAEFLKVRSRIESGAPIHEYMEESPVFPAMLTQMVQIGEESGSLDEMLATVADHFEMETRYTVKALTSLIEPLMTVVMGIMVLGLALGIFMPMWEMTKATKG